MGYYEDMRDKFDGVESSPISHLKEMANIKKHETGLPVNIWVDEGELYKKGKHGNRIKFQNNTANKVDHENLLSMSISDDPVVFAEDSEIRLSKKQVDKIKEFVRHNKDLLLKINKIGLKAFYDNMWCYPR